MAIQHTPLQKRWLRIALWFLLFQAAGAVVVLVDLTISIILTPGSWNDQLLNLVAVCLCLVVLITAPLVLLRATKQQNRSVRPLALLLAAYLPLQALLFFALAGYSPAVVTGYSGFQFILGGELGIEIGPVGLIEVPYVYLSGLPYFVIGAGLLLASVKRAPSRRRPA